jgi:DUF2075 family protein/thymidine kinase
VLAYLASKSQFLEDAPLIEDKVAESVFKNFNIKVGNSEYLSWRNSLGNAMSHVMRSESIPDDAGIAIEYRLEGRKFRMDFVISGLNSEGKESLLIIELKQWTDIQFSDLEEHVRTILGKGLVNTRHPSYQAWSYQAHLEQYNEYVYESGVQISACAYLHNCKDSTVISDSKYENALRRAPVFLHGGYRELQQLIEAKIKSGSGTELLRRIDSSKIRPSKQLADAVGTMLNGKEEFVLLDEQKTVFETIMRNARETQISGKKVLIVKGGPGTGKSVISINALAKLTGERLNAKYVTANAAPRDVFSTRLKSLIKGDLIRDLFSGSGSFTTTDSDEFDVLIVDEAHRLRMRSGMFRNLGESQTKEIINSSKFSVFFIDEAQKVTWSDVGEISRIKAHASELGADVEFMELTSQFRCNGSDDYMAWLDGVLGVQENLESYFRKESFDFKVFDSPAELHDVIRQKNKLNNKSRVVAGYCWNWVSKKDMSKFDIQFSDFQYKAKWNLSQNSTIWIISPNSVEEVGCIHTCQGLEVDYVGVIVGDDLIVRNGELVADPSARAKTDKSLAGYKKERAENPAEADIKADELIRNTYRTLMSRGMKGCYVYFTNPETRRYFEERMPTN